MMMTRAARQCLAFVKKEAVLCAAVVLALVSCLLVPPDMAYAAYIDWDTLALLFALMAVMKGFQQAGVFVYLGNLLLQRVHTTRSMLFALVFLPFFFSMVVTNDVALLTFVPFGIIVLQMAGCQQLLIPTVVLQTLAANLGSMLTPMGNPQNLYLYTRSGMGFGAVCGLMAPYTVLSAVCLAVLVARCKPENVADVHVQVSLAGRNTLVCCAAGFALCILSIFDFIPPLVVAAIVAAFLLFANRALLLQVDYSLLGTFVAFFIFIGNVGRLEVFRSFLAGILAGHEVPVCVLASQVISNVPAALLLSGFSENWRALLVGCNLGGLGTLIASMASLISYKMVAQQAPTRRTSYLVQFTVLNILLLAVLLAVWALGIFPA